MGQRVPFGNRFPGVRIDYLIMLIHIHNAPSLPLVCVHTTDIGYTPVEPFPARSLDISKPRRPGGERTDGAIGNRNGCSAWRHYEIRCSPRLRQGTDGSISGCSRRPRHPFPTPRRSGAPVHLAVATLGQVLALLVTLINAPDRAHVAALAESMQAVTSKTVEGAVVA